MTARTDISSGTTSVLDSGQASGGVSGSQPAVSPQGIGNGPVEREFTVQARSQARMTLRRFFAHKLAVLSLVALILVVIGAFVGPLLWKYNYQDLTDAYSASPSWGHPFGTDSIGHDELAQVMRGAAASLVIALSVAVVSTVIGTVIGAVAGYYSGLVDTLLMRFVDLLLTVPLFAVAIVIGYNINSNSNQKVELALLLSLLLWPSIARVVRGQFLGLREREYAEAARALGASNIRIMFRHLVPNALGSIIVNATVTVATAILTETALSYVGFGIKSPDTSLGLLVSDGVSAAQTRPWVFYFPGLVIVLIALTINFIGDGLRDAFDPQQNRVRA